MSVKEAAKRIGISVSTLYALIATRAVAYYRVGGRIILSEADVDAYLQSCRVGAAVPIPAAPRVQFKHLKI